MPPKKNRPRIFQQTAIGNGNIQIAGDNNQVVIYQGVEVIIPSAEAIALHRVSLKQKLEKEVSIRWGGMSFYIQEEGVTLPIEASPYETGQLNARTNLQASLKSAQRMLVLGDPGSGKTVALERLAWELCGQEEPVIPVLIRLFHYDGKPLAEWVRAHLQECGCLRLDDEQTLTAFLQEGEARCVFLFDGLNEVAPEYRNVLVGELDRWISAYPRHAIIITSRVQDELWRTLRGELPAMVVQSIHKEQACEYLTAHLGEKGNELYQCLDELLLALARTPLVLWLIKEAGAAGETLPGNRGELYARFTQRMLRRDTERQMNVQFPERIKQRALSILAMHMSQAQRLTCGRDEAVEVVANVLEKNVTNRWEQAEALVTACARHGLLAGENELWFAPHQTVQEYFAAVALQEIVKQEQQMSGAARLWRSILQIVTRQAIGLTALASKDWWMETFVQLAGIIEDPDWLARAVARTNPWLAWWCVQEGKIVDETTRAWIEDHSSKLLRSRRVANRRRAVQTLTQMRNERVLPLLMQAAADSDKEVSGLAVRGLSNASDVARPLVERALHGKDELLWLSALRYLRLFPEEQLWAEISEPMWDRFFTRNSEDQERWERYDEKRDRRFAVAAMVHAKNERFASLLLKAVADVDRYQDVSRLAVQGLMDIGRLPDELLNSQDGKLWRGILCYLAEQPGSYLWSDIAERIQADSVVLGKVRDLLKKQAAGPVEIYSRPSLLAKVTAGNALARFESGQAVTHYWKPPYGEPEWVTIPAGEYWMGEDNSEHRNERPQHKIFLPEYKIARVPVTFAQYALYIEDTEGTGYWKGRDIRVTMFGFENYPVRLVTWDDAIAYCKWLGEKIQKPVTLPSEAEWEKAARGSQDKRNYPWGDDWRDLHCHSSELGIHEVNPVGLFLNGASPYGVLDLVGNIHELTRSIYRAYPYVADDGREDLLSKEARTLRGGVHDHRCANRSRLEPNILSENMGFRIVVTTSPMDIS